MTKMKNIMSKIFFLGDEDGFSSRDFLLLTTMGMYFILFVYCVVSLINTKSIPEDVFKLFASTDMVVITVVGGTMGVVGIDKIVSSRNKQESTEDKHNERRSTYNTEEDDII